MSLDPLSLHTFLLRKLILLMVLWPRLRSRRKLPNSLQRGANLLRIVVPKWHSKQGIAVYTVCISVTRESIISGLAFSQIKE